MTGLLRVEGTIDLNQFWPVGESDADHGLIGIEIEGALDGVEVDPAVDRKPLGLFDLAGAAGISADFAKKMLIRAARQMRDHDPQRPWRVGEIDFKVTR